MATQRLLTGRSSQFVDGGGGGGAAAQYANVRLAVDTPAASGSTIVYDTVVALNGIAYNLATGEFTLTAGKTYLLTAGTTMVFAAATDAADAQWTNAAGVILTGSSSGLILPANFPGTNSTGAPATLIHVTGTTVVKVVVTGAITGGSVFQGARTWAEIVEIPGAGVGSTAGSVLTFGNGFIAAAADTRYLTPGFDIITALTAVREFSAPRAGTLRNLFVRQNNAPGAANANLVSYRVRINGVDTALTVSRAANAGVGQSSNIVSTVGVLQGDRIALVAVKALAIGSGFLVPICSVELA